MDINVLSDDLILPFGIERYSTDGEHLPLPPGRRKELDQHFYGDLWEPDAYARGFERDPIAILPLQPRMLANVHKHRSDIKYTKNTYCLSVVPQTAVRSENMIYSTLSCTTT